MDGIADMGGMHGFGPVEVEPNEPIFHADWERRTIGVQLAAAMAGAWIADECRDSKDRIPPAQYLTASYYEAWLYFFEDLMVRKGYVTSEELCAGRLITSEPDAGFTKLKPGGEAEAIFWAGGSLAMPSDRPVRFAKGHKVRARNIHPSGHTRLPRYLRGHVGTVINCLGTFAFADTRAHGLGEHPQPSYLVRFSGEELWGPDFEANSSLTIEMFDDYLDPA